MVHAAVDGRIVAHTTVKAQRTEPPTKHDGVTPPPSKLLEKQKAVEKR